MSPGAVLADGLVVQQVLRRGPDGMLYAAYDPLSGGAVAVKVLVARAPAPWAMARMRRAALAAAATHHPGIVPALDAGLLADGRPYLVMELPPPESLDERLQRRGPMPFLQAVRVVLQAGRALRAAHRAGVVHGALRPECVLLAEDGQARVSDFGVSRVICLPSPYQAPEAGGGGGESPAEPPLIGAQLDGRGDQYALAMLLCGALSGAPPAPGAGALGAAPVPPPLRPVLGRALSWHKQERYPTLGEFLAAVEAACPGLEPSSVSSLVPTPRSLSTLPSFSSRSSLVRPAPAAGPAAPRILVVDDDEDTTLALRDVFLFHGYHCDALPDGAHLIERVSGGPRAPGPDLVLLDVLLPGKGGDQLCREIKAAPGPPPVILMSGMAHDPARRDDLLRLADAYVDKPFAIPHLLKTVGMLLALRAGGARP